MLQVLNAVRINRAVCSAIIVEVFLSHLDESRLVPGPFPSDEFKALGASRSLVEVSKGLKVLPKLLIFAITERLPQFCYIWYSAGKSGKFDCLHVKR